MDAQSTTETGTSDEQPANIGAAADQSRTTDDLYFVACGKFVKVGRARDVRTRMSNMQCGSPQPLTLLATLQGRGYEEKVWHLAFAEDRESGEWFRATADFRKSMKLAIEGKQWWNHLDPPDDYLLSAVEDFEDEDDWGEAVVDWHIGIQMAIVGARDGEKPPLRNKSAFIGYSDEKLASLISIMAEKSWAEQEGKE